MKATEDIQIELFNKIGVKLREFDEKHGWIDYFIAPVIVTVILLVVYTIKGVYPFGVNTIAYYDMPTNHVTGYSWLWDVFHGQTGLYLNWNQGLGVSAATGGDAFFPVNWFFFFTTRDGILYALSFFLMIKLELMAFTMSYYSRKHFDSTFITVCTGVLYAFSGYVLQYYTNIFFLDFAIMFPLVVIALEKLLFEQKPVFYLIMMFFVFICNIQLIFMVCLYLIFKTYFMLDKVPSEKKGRALEMFAAGTAVALLTACFVILPEFMQLSGSVRVTDEDEAFNYMDAMKTIYNYFRRQKHFIMYGSEIAVGTLLMIFLRGKDKIRKYSDNIAMIVILGLPIIHEGINLMWHAGSYKHFPIRFGYMITFEFLILFGKYTGDEEFKTIKYIGKAAKIVGVAMLPFYAFVLYDFFKEFTDTGISELKDYYTYWIYFVTLTFGYFIIMLMETRGSRQFASLVLILIQVSLGCYGFVAPSLADIDTYRIKYIINSLETREQTLNTAKTDRIKLNMEEYDANDGMIIGAPTLTYWTYGISAATERELHENMGYSGISTAIMDNGGTVFSDALLGIKMLASSYNQDDRLYTSDPLRSRIHNCNYTLPFGIVFENDEIIESDNSLEYNNMLYKGLVKDTGELIKIGKADEYLENRKELTTDEEQEIMDFFIENGPQDAYILPSSEAADAESAGEDESLEGEDTDTEAESKNSMKEYDLQIPITGHETAYLDLNEDFSGTMMIIVDGRPLYMDSFMTHGSFTYPNDEINGILSLGSYDEGFLDVKLYSSNEDLKGINIGLLDRNILTEGIDTINTYQKLETSTGKNSMHVTGTINKQGTLFLPVGYSDNWHAKMNGKDIEVKPFLNDAFIGIDVKEGDVDIEFSYIPKGLISGILLSALGLVLGIVLVIFEKRGGLQGRRYGQVIDKIFIYGFYAVVAVLFIVMYVIPVSIKMSL